jgi:hypothetical protein
MGVDEAVSGLISLSNTLRSSLKTIISIQLTNLTIVRSALKSKIMLEM